MIQNRLSLIAIVLTLTLGFSMACQSDTKSSLVGRWKSNSAEGWEFKSDNKFERMTEMGIPITGTYRIEGENVVLNFDPKDENSEAPEPIKVKIKVSGDAMTLDDGQRKYAYKR